MQSTDSPVCVFQLRQKGFDVSAWAKDDDDKARSFRSNNTMVGKLWNKYGRKPWNKYGRYVKGVATIIGLAMVTYILGNIKIHGSDKLIHYGSIRLQWADQVLLQRARESMRPDWRLASGTKWNGRDMEMYSSSDESDSESPESSRKSDSAKRNDGAKRNSDVETI